MLNFVLTLFLAAFLRVEAAPVLTAPPLFAKYRAPDYGGRQSTPQIITADQGRFRTVLRRAISKGYGVVDGGTEHERAGANFAGHYVLVQWSCGLPCMEAALIDAKDGRVLKLPRIPSDMYTRGFLIPIGSSDLRELQFRTNSRLLGIPYAADGMTYWYALAGNWRVIGKTRTSVK